MGAAILGALKALPELVKVIGQLIDTISSLQGIMADKKINEIKEKNAEILRKIENASTDKELKKLIRDLNTNLSR